MKRKKIVLYHTNPLKFGGIDTFDYNFCKKMRDKYNILFLYKDGNLETIKSYEIELTTSENLFYKVEKYSKKNLNTNNLVINNQSKDNKKTIDLKQPQDKNSLYIKLDKKVISRADVYENRGYNYIFVDKGSLITDLAKEEAKKLNLKIKQE